MAVTAILITVSSILVGQSFLIILPLYVSLAVVLFQSRANRLAPLLGGINSIIYAGVYMFHQGLPGMALQSVLISCPIQLITFIRWRKNSYQDSTQFRKMTGKGRIILTAVSLGVWSGMCVLLYAMNSAYMLLDNSVTLLSTLVAVLTLFAYVEYAWLMLPNVAVNLLLYIVMVLDDPAQIPYLIFNIYSTICSIKGFISVRRLYAEQQEEKKKAEA